MRTRSHNQPSLENLIEAQDLGLEILHPGGLQITRELGELCHISRSASVLDVASGTGESACFLALYFGCFVTGVDASDLMIKRARVKAREKNINVVFEKADAQDLPFNANTFDVVISECTTCILDKETAIGEMARVAKRGGYVGIHDLCWKEDTPERLKRRLAEIEGEAPETLHGWKNLFERVGLEEVTAADKSFLMPSWGRDIKRRLGIAAQLKIFIEAASKWGLSGLRTVAESARILQSVHTGYGVIVGRKPTASTRV